MVDQQGRIGKRVLFVGLIVLLVVTASLSAVFYHAYRHALAANPTRQQQSISTAVSSLVVTPSETPEIATIKDASKLTNSALAQKAQNGDVLLIYGKTSQIIVYRPTLKKIVDMLTIQTTPAAATGTGATTPTQPATPTAPTNNRH